MEDRAYIIPIRQATTALPVQERRSPSRFLHYDASLPQPLVDALWNNPAEILKAGKLLRATPWRIAVLHNWDSQSYVIKRYFDRSLRHTILGSVVGSQALRSFQIGRTLADAGVRTPCPVACIENRRRGMQRDGYLIYPHVGGSSLRMSINGGRLSAPEIDDAWGQLEVMWQQLADLRVALYDANAGNFIVAPRGKLWLIDLDDARLHRSRVIARAILQYRWLQLSRSIDRARRSGDERMAPLARAA